MSQVFTLRWGILSTGKISSSFTKDLILDPHSRDAADIRHRVVAVASRGGEEGRQKANAFIGSFCPGELNAKALGTYEELFSDPHVDIVYIGTPHSHHYRNAKDALLAGKHVLCEKALTVNAKQAKELTALAAEKNLFLMEAVWTRFFPLTYALQALIKEGTIGVVRHVNAELAKSFGIDTVMDPGNRLIDPALAGGAILDLGPYPWTWIALVLLHPLIGENPTDRAALALPSIAASMIKSPPNARGDIDESTLALLKFPRPLVAGGYAHAVLRTDMRIKTRKEGIVIQGSKGHITVPMPIARPESFVVESWTSEESYRVNAKPDKVEELKFPVPGGAFGLVLEADECARCIRDGKVQSARMPWRESILQMEVFDEIRLQGGLVYGEIERIDGDSEQ
ncbi:hypothetical protein PLICRDRAFT_177690 [Plicaturopsis crispa FD-325 SS-3]|nr:hypothetical protein PLICRDRAFT_177690 [Plicaturopsis crispa FD-325 SS-3]